MLRVNVLITSISAERFWDIRKPIPPIQINTNINVVGMEKKPEESVEVPFVLSINYNPSVAQMNLKGIAVVMGDKEELEKALKVWFDNYMKTEQVKAEKQFNTERTNAYLSVYRGIIPA